MSEKPPGKWADPETQKFAYGFGERINIAIAATGLRKVDLARELGVQLHLPQSWVAARRLPSVPMLAKICTSLDVDAHWLIGLDRGVNTYSEVNQRIPEINEHTTPERLDEIAEGFMGLAREAWQLAERRRAQRRG